MIRTTVTRRTGTSAYVELAESRNNKGMMFMSSPPMVELTEGQALDLRNALDAMLDEIWP